MNDDKPNSDAERQARILEMARDKLSQLDPEDLDKMAVALKNTSGSSRPSLVPGMTQAEWVNFLKAEMVRRGQD